LNTIVYDEWLSGILEKQTYAIRYSARFFECLASPGSQEYQSLVRLQAGPVFIYAKVPTINIPAVNLLQSCGFVIIETSLFFEKNRLSDRRIICGAHIRTASSVDEPSVYALASRSFSFSRFHLDGAIEDALANKVKAEWTRSYFRGHRGDAMLVALENADIVGFVLLAHGAEQDVVIDLMAVAPEHRRKKIASKLIHAAETMFEKKQRIVVGTQAVNSASTQLYEKSGFRLALSQYVLHYHGHDACA